MSIPCHRVIIWIINKIPITPLSTHNTFRYLPGMTVWLTIFNQLFMMCTFWLPQILLISVDFVNVLINTIVIETVYQSLWIIESRFDILKFTDERMSIIIIIITIWELFVVICAVEDSFISLFCLIIIRFFIFSHFWIKTFSNVAIWVINVWFK